RPAPVTPTEPRRAPAPRSSRERRAGGRRRDRSRSGRGCQPGRSRAWPPPADTRTTPAGGAAPQPRPGRSERAGPSRAACSGGPGPGADGPAGRLERTLDDGEGALALLHGDDVAGPAQDGVPKGLVLDAQRLALGEGV